MDIFGNRSIEILSQLGVYTAAPFFEGKVAEFIWKFLKKLEVNLFQDQFGNIIAHYRPENSSGPAVAFVAHMDHPGFEVIEIDGFRALARALGGIPATALVNPTSVIVGNFPEFVTGITAKHESTVDPLNRKSERLVWIDLYEKPKFDLPTAAVFNIPGFELKGDTIYMRAVDDLAGCAAILSLFEKLKSHRDNLNITATEDLNTEVEVYGIFTRAEEVGLFGASLVAESGILPKQTAIISIESSSVLPGVNQGSGPIIRTGDAAKTFDSSAEAILSRGALSVQKSNSQFKYQRRLMYGGVCEATAFSSYGYSVTGIAFPLGNYHNSTSGLLDINGDVDAEYIKCQDYLYGIQLLTEVTLNSELSIPMAPDRLKENMKIGDEEREKLAMTKWDFD